MRLPCLKLPPPLVGLALGMILLAGGCVPRSALVLEQPFAPAAQRALELEPRTASVADVGGRCVCAADFPLPGAKDGPLAFTIYVEAAPTANAAEPDNARGFLIQHVGALAGKSVIASGSARCTGVLFDDLSETITLDLRFADGARLAGRFTARRDEPTVRMLQRRYRPDIAALNATPPPALASEETGALETESAPDAGAPTPPRTTAAE